MRKTETTLADDIQAWHDQCIEDHDSCPDFWDECDTAERLALWLLGKGYKKS